MAEPKLVPSTNGSTNNGRFTVGNSGGPGNPLGAQYARLRARLINRVKAGDVDGVVDTLVRKAKEGDVVAIKLLLAYTVGQPPQHIELSGQVQTAGPLIVVMPEWVRKDPDAREG